MSFDWKKVVGTVAPMIGTALGGPLGGIAGAAISKTLGCDNTDESISAAVKGATAQDLAKLQIAEQEFKIQMAKLGYESERDLATLSQQDAASARDREIKTGDNWTPRTLAALVVVAWAWITWFLLQHVVAQEMREIIMRSLGTLDMALGLVLGYYFGSSYLVKR